MKARDIMSANPKTCRENDAVFDAVAIMRNEDVGAVPIVDANDTCCGIVTDRDICLEVIGNNLHPQKTLISQVMCSDDLLTCSQDDELKDIISRMKERQLKRILVMEDNRCVGIISEHDIAVNTNKRTTGDLVGSVYA